MVKRETAIGHTHIAHETRHLARKMQIVREGGYTVDELKQYEEKLENERQSLITRFKDCWSFLNEEERVLDYTIYTVSVDEAAKYKYPKGLVPEDFLFISKLEMHYNYATPAPQSEHLHVGAMLLQGLIYDLSWAIAEVRAHIKQAERNIEATPDVD